MRSRLFAAAALGALTLTALAPASVAAAEDSGTPYQRGAPGTWTRITTGEVTNIAEPGLHRTADGVLHVLYHRRNAGSEDLAFTNISSTGKVVATGNAVTGWASLPSDPKVVAGPGGGMRLVFGGLQDTNVENPYSAGRMYSSVADAAGTSWTLQPGALTQSGYAYGSYGTGATTLADGSTPVVSFPLNTEVTWNAGGADAAFTTGQCCSYHTTLAREGDAVWAAYYSNSSVEAEQGTFVRQLLPTAGPSIKAPQSTTKGDSLAPGQSTPFVARPGGGLFATYCIGYPTCTRLGLWQVGSAKPVTVPGSAGAQEYAMAVGPGGRIWVAWAEADTNLVHATHTGTKGLRFGAVSTIKPPKGATIYRIAIAGSDGSADLVVGDGASMFHQLVLPGLSLKASPTAWKKATKRKVTFKVTDAGVAVKGAKVTARGKSCTTAGSGACSITFAPSNKKHRLWATARHTGYGAAKVRLRQK